MSVLIKGMEMPKSCGKCIFRYEYICMLNHEMVFKSTNNRHKNCPLIEIPPHGRLIDADALEADTEWDDREDGYISYSKVAIKCAPTIIEAEEDEDGGTK